jgi:hypothetical protein
MRTRMKCAYLSAALASVLVALLGGAVLAQSTDSQVGTWKLNLEKSTYSAGTATFEASPLRIGHFSV